MADSGYPLGVIGGVPVVAAPEEIDALNAGFFQELLIQAARGGHPAVVVNMAGTRFCDSSGMSVLLRVHERAVGEGNQLLLVIPPDAAVRRMFALTGVDRFIPHFGDLNEALEQAHAVSHRPPQQPAVPETHLGPDQASGSPAADPAQPDPA